jgi:hypothetical protein
MKQKFGSFSDAIRYGATLRPQAFGAYTRGHSTCAWGAGLEALLGRPLTIEECLSEEGLKKIIADTALWSRFAYLRTKVPSPCGCVRVEGFQNRDYSPNTSKSIANMIVHLNNEHEWSREQIADWLQSEEDKLGFVTISVTEESEALRNLTQELSDLGEVLKVSV